MRRYGGASRNVYTHPTGWEGRFTKERGDIYTLEIIHENSFGVESSFDVKLRVSRRNRELSPKNEYRRGEPLGGGRGRPHT